MLRHSDRRRRADRGSVTAEFAVALPAVVLTLVVALWAMSLAQATMRCVDAARAGARAAARGEAPAAVDAAARTAAPAGASVRSTSAGGLVTVLVQSRVTAPGLLSGLGGLTVSGKAVSALEGATSEPMNP